MIAIIVRAPLKNVNRIVELGSVRRRLYLGVILGVADDPDPNGNKSLRFWWFAFWEVKNIDAFGPAVSQKCEVAKAQAEAASTLNIGKRELAPEVRAPAGWPSRHQSGHLLTPDVTVDD